MVREVKLVQFCASIVDQKLLHCVDHVVLNVQVLQLDLGRYHPLQQCSQLESESDI